VSHPVRNFFIIVGLLFGCALLVDFAADVLQQAQAEKHSSAQAAYQIAAKP
jgi:hypothetical protein